MENAIVSRIAEDVEDILVDGCMDDVVDVLVDGAAEDVADVEDDVVEAGVDAGVELRGPIVNVKN